MCRHLQRHLYPYPPSGTDRGGGELPGPVRGPAVFPLRRLFQLAQSAPCAGPPDGPHRRPAALRLPRPAGSWVRHGQTRRCLHGCLPSGALYLGQRSIAGTVAALSPALLLAAVVSGRAADDLPDVVGPHRAAPGPPAPPPAGRPGPGPAGRPPGAGGGPEPPGAGSGQRAHPKRVAGRPALLPPGHLDGIAAGADRGPAAGLALAGGGGGVPSGTVGAQPHGIPGPPCGDGAGRGVRDGGLCGRSGGEKPGAEEDRLPLRTGADLLYLCLSCAHLRGDEGVERHCAGLCLGHGAELAAPLPGGGALHTAGHWPRWSISGRSMGSWRSSTGW